MANIRDSSWVHSAAPEAATEKAVETRQNVHRPARTLWPLEGGTLAVDQTGIVIGGGLSGNDRRARVANKDSASIWSSKSDRLGGTLPRYSQHLRASGHRRLHPRLMIRSRNIQRFKTYLEAEITSIKGHIGKFHLALAKGGAEV